MTILGHHQVQLHHTYSVSLEDLYAACEQGALLKLCGLQKKGKFTAGEKYHHVFKNGADFIKGEFKSLVLLKEIVFTWETLAGEENIGVTTVTLRFSREGSGSRLDLDQTGIASLTACEDQNEGWTDNLQRLGDSFTN